jgi:hypothetical protein
METNASDFILGVVLFQEGERGRLHLVAFYSRLFFATEINYKIHNKELLAIVDSFQEWRHFLEGAVHQVIVYINHKNLKYFMIAYVLNCRQPLWNMSLSWYDFIITYRPKKQQRLSSALSRWSYLVPNEGEAVYEKQRTTLLKVEQLHLCAAIISSLVDSSFLY